MPCTEVLPWLRDFETNDYSKFWTTRRIEDEAEKKIVKGWLRPGNSCLELGGGFGRITKVLEQYFHRVAMVDLTMRNLRMAKTNLEGASILCSDVSTLPMRSEMFDTVVMVRVAHFLPDPSKTMAEILRVIKDGGTLIMSFPNLLIVDHIKRIVNLEVFLGKKRPPRYCIAQWPLGERPYLSPERYFIPKYFRMDGKRGTGLFDNSLGRSLSGIASLSQIDIATSPFWFFKPEIFCKFVVSKSA